MQNKHRLVFYTLTFATIVVLFLVGPIHQDHAYHHFADNRKLFDVPNFFNVISNLPFVIIGLWGISKVYKSQLQPFTKTAYLVFSIGIVFTGIGSAYYHWHPTSLTLVWDRLPMTVAFMSFFSIMISPYFNKKWEYWVLIVLIMSGFLSVLYWYLGDCNGEGDLRPYIFVQYYPLVIVIISLFGSASEVFPKKILAISFLFYFLAKILEATDGQILALSSFISGHTLKHLAASAASLAIIISYEAKTNLAENRTRF